MTMTMTNLVNAVDQHLKWMAAVFKGTQLIQPWFARHWSFIVIEEEPHDHREEMSGSSKNWAGR
jgi:hypothetical protein